MAEPARSSMPRGPRMPLTACVALLLMSVVLAVGGGLGIHNDLSTSRIVLDAANAVFQRMGREVALELARTTTPAELLVDVVSEQDVTEAKRLDERMRALPAFAAALRENAALSALYVGYDDGDFFLVRALRDRATREALGAPAAAAFAVQSVEAAPAHPVPSTKFVYAGDDLAILGAADRADFAFDPRARGWYETAIAADRGVRTPPYLFFTTREPGITFARRSRSRRSVVGADITLARLSELLGRQPIAPSSELFLVTGEAYVVAQNGSDPAAPPGAGDARRLETLADIPRASAAALAQRVAASATGQTFDFVAGDRAWIGRVERLDGDAAAPLDLAIAAPRDELLVGARQVHERSLAVTLAAIVLALPLAWFVASRVSRPLRRLASDAHAIQSLDFSPAAPVRSIVREVDGLGRALRSSRDSLRRFVDISDALAAERDIERLMRRVLDETMQLAGANAAAVHLVDHERRVLDAALAVRADAVDAPLRFASLSLAGAPDASSPLVRAAVDARTILADLPRGDPSVAGWLEPGSGGGTTLALLATPLRNRAGEVIGVLSLASTTVRAAAVRSHVVAFIEKLSGVAAIALETQQLLAEQKALLDAFIQVVAAAIDAKSPYTGGHCQRVPALAKMLAQAACDARDGAFRDFRMSDDEWEALHIASWLHDCGKVTTPEYVVDKATKLSTIHDRIHEVRTRFEVLKRDAEIAFWNDRQAGGDEAVLAERLAAQWRSLDDDFAFVARCNEGGESMDDTAIERIRRIAQRTWRRTLDDRIGISWEERARKDRRPAPPLPATEPLLSDAPEHLIERQPGELMPDDNRWGFRLSAPQHRYDLGEVHNLSVRRGTLTAEERYRINDHIVQTIVMLGNLPFPRHLAAVPEIAGGHHETMDGRGYPRRLVADEMSTLARMMAIADIFEALTAADRPYKKGKTLSESLSIMARMRDERHIDADLFDLFLTSGVYRRYAEAYLAAEQIDDVDVTALRGAAAPRRDRPVPA